MSPEEAAQVITRVFRRFNTRCKARRLVRGKYASRIQAWFRHWRTVTPPTHRQEASALAAAWARHQAAQDVQRIFRGYVARRRAPHHRLRPVAAMLQCLGRGFVARWWAGHSLATRRADQISPGRASSNGIDDLRSNDPASASQVLVPVGYRVAADANEFVMRLRNVKNRARENSAVLIQHWWRDRLARERQRVHERTLSRLLVLNDFAIALQRWWRRVLKRRAEAAARKRRGGSNAKGVKSSAGEGAAPDDTIDQSLVVRHSILATERGAQRRFAHGQLLSIWTDVTGGDAPLQGGGRLPPLTGTAPASATPTPGGRAQKPKRRSNPPPPVIPHRAPVAGYAARMQPEGVPKGRYAAYSNNGRQIWNSATQRQEPKWYEGERDQSAYKRRTVTAFM
jgi:hypothetical protein